MTPQATPTGITAEQALARYRESRDPAALAALFDLTAGDLFRVALHVCSDPAAAEDALQETFLAVMEHADRYEPGRPARPWLAAILRHHASKSRWKRGRSPDPARLPPQAESADPALEAATAEEMERLRAAMDRLPEPYRGVALLRWRYGLEPAAIADVKGVPPGTVWSWLHRAVARLKADLATVPALLLVLRSTRGIEGVKGAVVRHAAARAVAASAAPLAAGTVAAVATGGAVMGVKAVVAGTAAVALLGWFLLRPDAGATFPPGEAPPPALPIEDRPPPAEPLRAPPPAPPKREAPGEGPRPSGPPGVFDPSLATATVRIHATMRGNPPVLRPIDFSGDPECSDRHAGAPVLQQTVVQRGGKLANVIAWVSKGAERWSYATPQDPVVIDQRGCMYEPHVLTLMVHQPLTIRSSDPFCHNIHAVPKINEPFNHSQLKGAKDLLERFEKEEVPIRVKCDIHGWMTAWAGVFAHPFHGVTGTDGAVTIRLPPGEYELSSWHEYGKFAKPEPQKVSLAAGETKEIEFLFEAR